MRALRLFLILVVLGGPVTAESPVAPLIDDLKSIEAEMLANQSRIEGLQNELGSLEALGIASQAEIERLQLLVEDHSARVGELGERYAQALITARRLEEDLEASTRLNWFLGGGALVAVLLAAGEALALAAR